MTRFIRYLRSQHIGLVALFIALGGTSYAAVQIPRNSVGSGQIRTGGVGTSEIKKSSVTSTKVKNGSLLSRDFKAGELPRGAPGAPGATGAAGPKGDAGPVETFAVRLNRGGMLSVPDNPGGPMGGPGTANTVVTWTDAQAAYEIGNADMFDQNRPAAGGVAGDAAVRIPRTGLYSLSAGVRWAVNPTGARALSVSGPNGSILATSQVPANATTGVRTVQNVSTTTRLNAGDLVYVSAGQNSGGALNIESSLAQVHFAVTYVSPAS